MTARTRRALRVTATLAGVAALGAALPGTAFADDAATAEQDNSLSNRTDGSDGTSDPLSVGTPLNGLGGGFLDFALPTAGPSLAPSSLAPSKKDDDDDQGGTSGKFHHDNHGAGDVYDFDLYNPTEHYDENKCKDKGADRGPLTAFGNSSLPGYNGDSQRDCKVDSGDYHPKKTGYQGDDRKGDNGYSGYVGSDPERQAKDDYLFGLGG